MVAICWVPREWADDEAASHLPLRLEAAERYSGVTLLDPGLPLAGRSPRRVPGRTRPTTPADLADVDPATTTTGTRVRALEPAS